MFYPWNVVNPNAPLISWSPSYLAFEPNLLQPSNNWEVYMIFLLLVHLVVRAWVSMDPHNSPVRMPQKHVGGFKILTCAHMGLPTNDSKLPHVHVQNDDKQMNPSIFGVPMVTGWPCPWPHWCTGTPWPQMWRISQMRTNYVPYSRVSVKSWFPVFDTSNISRWYWYCKRGGKTMTETPMHDHNNHPSGV